jgi:hypothetical protein
MLTAVGQSGKIGPDVTAKRQTRGKMSEHTDPSRPRGAAIPWWRRFGRRNIAYLIFLMLLVPFGIALEASGPRGPDSGGGVGAAVLLGGLASAAYLAVNAVLAVVALIRGRPLAKPLIACALPIAIVLLMLLLEDLTVS